MERNGTIVATTVHCAICNAAVFPGGLAWVVDGEATCVGCCARTLNIKLVPSGSTRKVR